MADPEDDDFNFGELLCDGTPSPHRDPRFIAAMEKAIASKRAESPPVNCWLDAVGILTLYLDGVERAYVDRHRGEISLLDGAGQVAETFCYLCSENPYDLVEERLGAGRISDIRDESDDGWGDSSQLPREREERSVAAFREHYYADEEFIHYLRWAIDRVTNPIFDEHTAASEQYRQLLLDGLIAFVCGRHDDALSSLRSACQLAEEADIMNVRRDGNAACIRAKVLLERLVAVPLKGKPVQD